MLTPVLEAGDTAGAETLVNVIFEGGYYQQIKLTWLVDGKQQVWDTTVKANNVPQWFIDLNLFANINKQTTITSGWLQLATLVLRPSRLWLSRIVAHYQRYYYFIFYPLFNRYRVCTNRFKLDIKTTQYPFFTCKTNR
ncbi:hypothetical protein PEC18_35590 [Paucibacter sp. O1-1]|nr:hypothetical protein [Paucibacter sp. O1-1]MDA3830986.1 hypothetical protein [Paucibacter sp. O1-1]